MDLNDSLGEYCSPLKRTRSGVDHVGSPREFTTISVERSPLRDTRNSSSAGSIGDARRVLFPALSPPPQSPQKSRQKRLLSPKSPKADTPPSPPRSTLLSVSVVTTTNTSLLLPTSPVQSPRLCRVANRETPVASCDTSVIEDALDVSIASMQQLSFVANEAGDSVSVAFSDSDNVNAQYHDEHSDGDSFDKELERYANSDNSDENAPETQAETESAIPRFYFAHGQKSRKRRGESTPFTPPSGVSDGGAILAEFNVDLDEEETPTSQLTSQNLRRLIRFVFTRANGFASSRATLATLPDLERQLSPENGTHTTQHAQQQTQQEDDVYRDAPDRHALEHWIDLCDVVCGVSPFLAASLRRRMRFYESPEGRDLVTERQFVHFWNTEVRARMSEHRMFNVMRRNVSRRELTRTDIRMVVEQVLKLHPGLAFLRSSPAFEQRYVEAVVARVFYVHPRLTRRAFVRSKLPVVLSLLPSYDCVNDARDFFSYEHFYVAYCKFWELEALKFDSAVEYEFSELPLRVIRTDESDEPVEPDEFCLSMAQLAAYGEDTLIPRVVERIHAGYGMPLQSDRFAFGDFVAFLCAVEDKRSDAALDYWFSVLDIDSDGVLTVFELGYFLEQQIPRIQALSDDTVTLNDVVCQLNDLVKPKKTGVFTKTDLRRSGLQHIFFNTLFDLRQFLAFESRDPSVIEEPRLTPGLTDFDRFCQREYHNYTLEAKAVTDYQQQQQQLFEDELGDHVMHDDDSSYSSVQQQTRS
ncbi:MAG: hypothetical protein MHM6MM_005675 [Cercozoa sp. M6MM]